MTFREALLAATRTLAEAGVEDPHRDARWLLAFASGVGRDRVSLMGDEKMSASDARRFEAAVESRAGRVPVSQIVGEKSFFGRDFRVNAHVLTPRPETETLVELALSEPFCRVLDLGTGSGAILVTLLAERPTARGVGTDVSHEAVLVAGENAARHGVEDRITLPLSDWWHDVGSRYDLIVANPPYIASKEMPDLMPEVTEHEPRIALTDEGDGLSAYRKIVVEAPGHLEPGGRLMVEIGHQQAKTVVGLFEAAGLTGVCVAKDLDGRDRVVLGRKTA